MNSTLVTILETNQTMISRPLFYMECKIYEVYMEYGAICIRNQDKVWWKNIVNFTVAHEIKSIYEIKY